MAPTECLPACFLACLLACLPACLIACLLACLLAWLLAWLPACLLALKPPGLFRMLLHRTHYLRNITYGRTHAYNNFLDSCRSQKCKKICPYWLWTFTKVPWLLFFLLSSSCSATISFLGWNCKIMLSILRITIHVIYKWIIKLYLDIVDEVQEDLHNAGEDHQACAGDKKDVDVFKWLILLFFGSCKPL